jgi:hypothetical protein
MKPAGYRILADAAIEIADNFCAAGGESGAAGAANTPAAKTNSWLSCDDAIAVRAGGPSNGGQDRHLRGHTGWRGRSSVRGGRFYGRGGRMPRGKYGRGRPY